jgi:hypothetical protein
MNVIRQVAKDAKDATHHIYNATHYILITTLSRQVIFNYYVTPL